MSKIIKNIFLVLLLFLLGNNALAIENDIKTNEKKETNYTKPIIYTATCMGIGYGALVLTKEVPNPNYRNFKNAYKTLPKSDGDSAIYNFVLHPLWGSETYLRAREANFNIISSIAFSMGSSIIWEYLIESWSQHPSLEDLIITTGIGWIIGEIRYILKKKTNKKMHWLLDPINTTLECINIEFLTDSKGKTFPSIKIGLDY